MATFSNTTFPTPFGIYDSETDFQSDANNMVTFVKRKLGDDILSVELTKKQIWGNFEEAIEQEKVKAAEMVPKLLAKLENTVLRMALPFGAFWRSRAEM